MRFFISSNIKGNRPLYVTVLLFLFSSLLYWTSSWFFYGAKFGLTYDSMFTYFFTDPSYPERLPLSQLLEDMHVQMFLYVTFILVLSSIFMHKCMRDRVKFLLISLSFLSGVGDILSGLGVYFLGPFFIYLKLLFFFVFQISSGAMLALTLKLYITGEKEEPPERSILYSLVFIFALLTVLFTALNFFYSHTRSALHLKLWLTTTGETRLTLQDPRAWRVSWRSLPPTPSPWESIYSDSSTSPSLRT